MRRPTRAIDLFFAVALLSVCIAVSAADAPQDTGGACIPASERAGREFACFILAAQPIGKLDHQASVPYALTA